MESKIEATERLRREGRWNEASEFRDTERRRLRENGIPRSEASELAWTAMIAKFAPDAVDDFSDEEVEELAEVKDANSDDWIRDVLWVYNNLGSKSLATIPSAGARCMLKWAKGNQDRFFDSLLPKAIAASERRTEEHKRFHDDGRKIMEKLEKYEASLRKDG